jgi:SAM-dependent methyltransferase
VTPSSNRIRFVSPPAKVNMGDAWFRCAHLHHFWIRRRFDVLSRLAEKLIREAHTIAEVGCGHGLVQRQIEDYYQRQVTGFDLNSSALHGSVSRMSPLCCYDLFQRDQEYRHRFDVILLLDVLEHIEDQQGFLEALQSHLAVGGKVLINVPAFQTLYSNYDRAVGHVRRYTAASLRQVAERNGLRVSRYSYWGLPLVPLLVLRRLCLLGRTPDEIIRTGFDDRGPIVNRLLLALSRCEWVPQRLVGTSLMAIVERPD